MKFATAIAILISSTSVPTTVVAYDQNHERVRGQAIHTPKYANQRNLTPNDDIEEGEGEDPFEGVSNGNLPPVSKGGGPPGDEVDEELPDNPGNGHGPCAIHIPPGLQRNRNPPGFKRRSERAQANFEDLPARCDGSDEITIDLPDGTSKKFQKGQSTPPGHFWGGELDRPAFWAGEDESGSSFDYIRSSCGGIAGSFTDLETGEVYQFGIDYEGNDIVRITPTDAFPPEGDPVDDGMEIRSLRHVKADDTDHDVSTRHLQTDTRITTRVDVMVLWTEAAECENAELAAGCSLTSTTHKAMKALVNLAIAESNNAFVCSGVHIEFNLVHAYRNSYVESGTFGTDLYRLRSQTDGSLDNIHILRDQKGADVVAMIVADDPEICGRGYFGPAEERMFSVTSWSCATGYYSFVHEIGHNFGLHHARGEDRACDRGGYNYGYREPSTLFRSIMAYNCDYENDLHSWNDLNCDLGATTPKRCPRVQRFSNTEYKYQHWDIGSPDANNARVLNENKDAVAAYRDTPLVSKGWSPSDPLKNCEGDCDNDSHCRLGLKCFHRNDMKAVPGCTGSGLNGMDYCIVPPLINLGWSPSPSYRLNACEGDCDNDSNCAPGLECFHRNDKRPVPGCTGSGTNAMDYCYVPPKDKNCNTCPGPCRSSETCAFPAYVMIGYNHCPTSDCFQSDCLSDGEIYNPLQSIGYLLRPGFTLPTGKGITYKGYEFGLSPIEGILTFFEHMDMSVPEKIVWLGPAVKGKDLKLGLDGVLRVLGEDEATIWEAGNCKMEKRANVVEEVDGDSFVVMTNEGQVKLVKNGVMVWSVNVDGTVFDACAGNEYLISEK